MSDSLFDEPQENMKQPVHKEDDVLTVKRLNLLVKNRLALEFSDIYVKGEVSNLSVSAAGHTYFTLKDENAEISAVWFRSRKVRNRQAVEEGREIIVRGTVSVYERRGRYQIIVESVQEKGRGDLQKKFEELVEKLRKEGLFDEKFKKVIPLLPSKIGIVTSKTGAAVTDMTNMIWNRLPGAHVVIGPARVQGDQAADEIAEKINMFNVWGGVDVLIVGRGGGSLEDLWPFNEEKVARAIFESDIPVISAVGHEKDITISDLVADARALTPTKGGEMAVPDAISENQMLDSLFDRCCIAVKNYIRAKRSELRQYRYHRIFAAPEESLRLKKQNIQDLAGRLRSGSQSLFRDKKKDARTAAEVLESLNPVSVLKRGFSYTQDSSGSVVSDPDTLEKGDIIHTVLQKGTVDSEVINTEKGNVGGMT